MARYTNSTVIANNEALAAGGSISANIPDVRSPTVAVHLDALGALADDTISVYIRGDAGEYLVHQETNSAAGVSSVFDIPPCHEVRLESSDGATYSAEAFQNPR